MNGEITNKTFGPQRCAKCGKTHYVGECPKPAVVRTHIVVDPHDMPLRLHHHDRHPWAQSGDQPERLWMLVFSDADQGVMTWRGEDAEKEAREAYARYQVTWTCSLLATVEAHPSPGVSREGVARAKELASELVSVQHHSVEEENATLHRLAEEAAQMILSILARGEG